MENSLAIFDWEGVVTCKTFGAALVAQKYAHGLTCGNLPVPSTLSLADQFQYKPLVGNPREQIGYTLDAMLEVSGQLLSKSTGDHVNFLLNPNPMCTVRRVEHQLSQQGRLDTPYSAISLACPAPSNQLVPLAPEGISTGIGHLTPRHILEGVIRILEGEHAAKRDQKLRDLESQIPLSESEPLYPGILETIQGLKTRGVQLALVHTCPEPTTSNQHAVAQLFDHFQYCGKGSRHYKPDPVILRECVRTIAEKTRARMIELVQNSFYACSGHNDVSMAMSMRYEGVGINCVHCLYSGDWLEGFNMDVFRRSLMGAVNIQPWHRDAHKRSGETNRKTEARLAEEYLGQHLSFANRPEHIPFAMEILRQIRKAGGALLLGGKPEKGGEGKILKLRDVRRALRLKNKE